MAETEAAADLPERPPGDGVGGRGAGAPHAAGERRNRAWKLPRERRHRPRGRPRQPREHDAAARLQAESVQALVGRVAERLGRLKLNGRIVSYSPLSRLAELEGLGLLLAHNASLWRSLETIGEEGAAGLAERAERHVEALAPFRRDAATARSQGTERSSRIARWSRARTRAPGPGAGADRARAPVAVTGAGRRALEPGSAPRRRGERALPGGERRGPP